MASDMDFLGRFGLDCPVVQAGMGGGVDGAELAGAVSAAGALGTVGMLAPSAFAAALAQARRRAAGRQVAANLLVPSSPGLTYARASRPTRGSWYCTGAFL